MFFWLDFIEAKVKLNYTILISYYLRDTLFFLNYFPVKAVFLFSLTNSVMTIFCGDRENKLNKAHSALATGKYFLKGGTILSHL